MMAADRTACHLVGQTVRARFFASKHACAKRGALPRVANSIVPSARVCAPGLGCMRTSVRSIGQWTEMPGCAAHAFLRRLLPLLLLGWQLFRKRVDLGIPCR